MESEKSIGSAGGRRALGWTSTGSSLSRPGGSNAMRVASISVGLLASAGVT
jgi:hypothetical protein